MTDSTIRLVPCVLMRGGTSRGPFFLREWLPDDEVARDEALIGAIGASDLVPVDGRGPEGHPGSGPLTEPGWRGRQATTIRSEGVPYRRCRAAGDLRGRKGVNPNCGDEEGVDLEGKSRSGL